MNPKTALFYFGVVTFLAALSNADPESQKVGEFIKSSANNPDFKKYLEAMGYGEDIQKAIMEAKIFIIAIQKLDKNKYHVKLEIDDHLKELTFESGKEFDTKLLDGRKVKNTITVNKDKTVHRVIKLKDYEATQDLLFNHKKLTVTLKAKEAVATLNFEQFNTADTLSGRDWTDIIWTGGGWGG